MPRTRQSDPLLTQTASEKFNLIDLIPTYDEGESLGIRRFLEKINGVANLGKWSNDEKVTILKLKLAGIAEEFFLSDPTHSHLTEYNDIARILIKRFEKAVPLSTRLHLFSSCMQGSSESVQEFAAHINKLGTQIFQSGNSAQNTAVRSVNDQLLQSRFISDLRNDIRRFVLARDPMNLEESISAALIEEQNMKLNQIANDERSGLSPSQTENSVISALTNKLEEINLRVGRLQEASSVTARKTDFRKLNEITLTQDFVIPTLDDILHEISGSNYFSALDMKSAFNQIPLHFADRHKTAFSTPDGDKYEFNRLCFGLKNSLKAFQSIAQEVLGDLLHNGALVYIDDIILFTKTIDEHFELLGKVFERFERIHLKFNPSKCQFLTKSCKFLGFVVTPEGIIIDKNKSVSINEFPVPTDQKQIKSFLGCCNFYRRYIKNFAKRALPLTNLLRKDTPFQWTSETQEAFDDIKKAILNPPVLALPDPNAELQITTDALSRGIGAVLEQKYPNSEVKPLYFFPKKLNPSQSKYNATVLEFFAIYTALNFFRPFLLGRKFKVFTDHKPLAGFLSNKNPSSKILRWKLVLEEFNYDIHYIRGSLNSVADHLSRCINNITIALPDSKDLIKMQHEDSVLSTIIQKIDQNNAGPQVRNYFINGEGLLCHLSKRLSRSPRSNTTRKQVCIPHCLKAKTLESVHSEYGGHLKFFKTYHRLSENFFWQNMYKDTKNFVRSCTICLSRKNAFKIPPAPHQPVEQSQKPGETCHIDIFGPLKTTPKGNIYSYVLSMIDAFTKYIHIVPLPDIRWSTISKAFFDNYIVHRGCPHKLVVDNATYFKSSEFVEFCRVMGIHKRHISSYSAHVNGRVEKPNQSLANILASISQNINDWDEQIPHTMLALNSAIHEATYTSPFFLEHGRDIRLSYTYEKNSDTPQNKYEYVEKLLPSLEQIFNKVLNNLKDQEASHVDLSTRATKQHHYDHKIGALCFIKTPNIKSNLSPKLRPKFDGPYRVIERFSNVNYRVQHVEQLRKRFNTHVNRMIPFIKRFSYLHLNNLDDLQPDETEVKGIVPSPRYNLRARAGNSAH
ncbi:transposon Tf2-9 polyprotein [Trichonephila clavipes]|nr:transposon Tf2-9 polyprotein [Trichonephila clavipes]